VPSCPTTIRFVCNVCGQSGGAPLERIDREVASCAGCASTVRFRSVVHVLSTALWGKSIPLPDFPAAPSISGIGLSDWDGYAARLAGKLDYTNTFYHQRPFLDVTAPPVQWKERFDFLIASDIFEHVPPPVSKAFEGAAFLLKPGGHLILTVPYSLQKRTVEHFPEIHEYRVIEFDGERVLLNTKADGTSEVHSSLTFHGGPGAPEAVVEMRVFCEKDLLEHLRRAGFDRVEVQRTDVPEYGIIHKQPWSLPVLAQKASVRTAGAAGSTATEPTDRKKHILLACLPKSGSTYLASTLMFLPGMRKVALTPAYERREQELGEAQLQAYDGMDYVAQHHVRCSAYTRRLIEQYDLRPVVLVRNLFDIAVSLKDHLIAESPEMPFAFFDERILCRDETARLDAIIDLALPWCLNFYVSWQAYDGALLVTYEDMVSDPERIVDRIAAFAGLTVEAADIRRALAQAAQAPTRRNVGRPGRGAEQLTESQRARILRLALHYPDADFAPLGIVQ
jgi:hypothetical protein